MTKTTIELQLEKTVLSSAVPAISTDREVVGWLMLLQVLPPGFAPHAQPVNDEVFGEIIGIRADEIDVRLGSGLTVDERRDAHAGF